VNVTQDSGICTNEGIKVIRMDTRPIGLESLQEGSFLLTIYDSELEAGGNMCCSFTVNLQTGLLT
jgi:hypothetical protein